MGLRPFEALQQLRQRGDPGCRLRSKPTRLRKTLRGPKRRGGEDRDSAQLRGGTHVGFGPGGSNGNAAGGRGESGGGRRGSLCLTRGSGRRAH